MPGLLPDVDPHGLLEYSVVFTDRALNHMSQKFQRVMRGMSEILKEAYHAKAAIVMPGWRHVRDGGRGSPVRDRPEGPGDPERLVQLSLGRRSSTRAASRPSTWC